MSESEIVESLEEHLLARVQNEKAEALFIGGGIDVLLPYIEEQIDWDALAKADLEKESGRKEVKSTAFAVARVKTTIDGLGKDMVADKKKEVKAIDAVRKRARDFLEDLQARVKERLTEREDRINAELEAKRLAEEKKRQEEAEELERLRAEKARRDEEDARKARGAQIAKEAAEKARQEAKAQGEREILRREQEKGQARADMLNAIYHEAMPISIVDLAEMPDKLFEALVRERRGKAECLKRKEMEEIAARERDRIEAEQAMAEMERERRSQDEELRARVYDAVSDDLVQFCGVTRNQAKNVVVCIAYGRIRHVSIDYTA